MNAEKEKILNGQSVFDSEGQAKKIRAGSMSMVVGVSETLDQLGETEELDPDEYPELPEGVSGDYDTWLG